MTSKQLPRLAAISVLTGVGVLSQTGVAHAADAMTTDSDTNVTTTSSVAVDLASQYAPAGAAKVDCSGLEAIQSVIYKVDGVVVSDLNSHVAPGSKVTVTFKLVKECDDTQVGLAAYQAPSDHWDPKTADQQKLVSHNSGTFKAGTTNTLEISVPNCFYQVDFFTGPVLEKLTADHGYSIPDGNLISADNGGTTDCVTPPTTTPPTTTPPTTTPPTTAPTPTTTPSTTTPPADTCPTDAAARITSYTWTINGVPGFKTLEGNVKPGDTVKVDFNIAAGCDDEELSLASYKAPTDSFTEENAVDQVLVDSESGKFGAGDHSMDVKIDACYFQVDFVHGGVIAQFGPAGSDNYYGHKIIEATNGGTQCSTPTEVAAESITATPAAELAYTGSNTTNLAMIGASLLLLGAAMERGSRRIRRTA